MSLSCKQIYFESTISYWQFNHFYLKPLNFLLNVLLFLLPVFITAFELNECLEYVYIIITRTLTTVLFVLSGVSFVTVLDEQTTKGRIYSLHWLGEKTLLTCHSHGTLIVWKICCAGGFSEFRFYIFNTQSLGYLTTVLIKNGSHFITL